VALKSIAVLALALLAGALVSAGAENDIADCRSDLGVLNKVIPAYPYVEFVPLEGYVVLDFIVNKAGHPIDITVVESSSKIFHRSAIAAMSGWLFEPPGTPCRRVFRMEYLFEN